MKLDDWSLKGKRINEPDCEMCSTEKIYPEKEIDTLRKKLIKDLKRLYTKNCDPEQLFGIYGNAMIKTIIEITNKRFGYETGD